MNKERVAKELVKLAKELTSDQTAEQERASEDSGYTLMEAVSAIKDVVTLKPMRINGQTEKEALNLLKRAEAEAQATDDAAYIKSIVELRNQFKKSIGRIRKEFAVHQKYEERWQKTTEGLMAAISDEAEKMLEKSLEIAGGWD